MQIAMVVALEVLYPSHFSLVYGGDDGDEDGDVGERGGDGGQAAPSAAGAAPEPPQQSFGGGVVTPSSAAVASGHHQRHAAAAPDGVIGVLDALGGDAEPDRLDHSLHTPLEV